MRLVTLISAGAALVGPAAATAQTMNAQTFYARASALQKKGPLALFSGGEIRALTAEGKAAGAAARAARIADQKAGRQPRYCPPAQVAMGSNEVMAHLAAMTPAERARIDMTEAMTRLLAAKFPCRR